MKIYFNTLMFLLCAFAAMAQTPQKFNYQAVARNAQGAILPSQNVNIRASILDGSANGTSQYTETHNATTSQLGLFNLAIGGGTLVSGNFSSITWATGNKYLKIEMDATGGNNFSLVGTSQLLSVPYALNAGNGSLWTNNPNTIQPGINYQAGNVNIGDSSTVAEYNLGFSLTVVDVPSAQIHLRTLQTGNGAGITFTPGDTDNSWSIDAAPDYPTVPNRKGLNFSYHEQPGEFPASHEPYFTINPDGNVGVNQRIPKSKLQVAGGDIFIEDINQGVIMKSPNGQCWRMTVNNAGQPVFTSITCP